MDQYCNDRSADYEWRVTRDGGGLTVKQCFLYGAPELASNWVGHRPSFFPERPGGVMALYPRHGWSFIRIPGMTVRGGRAPELLYQQNYCTEGWGCSGCNRQIHCSICWPYVIILFLAISVKYSSCISKMQLDNHEICQTLNSTETVESM